MPDPPARQLMKPIQDLKGKTAVVTGGAGFVPSHLIDRLPKPLNP